MVGALIATGVGVAGLAHAYRAWWGRRRPVEDRARGTPAAAALVMHDEGRPLLVAAAGVGAAVGMWALPLAGGAWALLGGALLGAAVGTQGLVRWADWRLDRFDARQRGAARGRTSNAGPPTTLQRLDARCREIAEERARIAERRRRLATAVEALEAAVGRPTSADVRARAQDRLARSQRSLSALLELEVELDALLIEESVRLIDLAFRDELATATRRPDAVDAAHLDRVVDTYRRCVEWMRQGWVPTGVALTIAALRQPDAQPAGNVPGWRRADRHHLDAAWVRGLAQRCAAAFAEVERRVNDWRAEQAMASVDRVESSVHPSGDALFVDLDDAPEVDEGLSAAPSLVSELRGLDLDQPEVIDTTSVLATVRRYRARMEAVRPREQQPQ